MTDTTTLDFITIAILLLAAWSSWQWPWRKDLFWTMVVIASVGSLFRVTIFFESTWQTGLAATLWVSVAACMAVFASISAMSRTARYLFPLLMPYLVLLALIAAFGGQQRRSEILVEPIGWLEFHIIVSVVTYAMLTIAATAALATFVQERDLKTRKRLTIVLRLLPSMIDTETLSSRLLAASQIILGLGLASGMAVQYLATGMLLRLDHKTFLSLLAFAVIATLLLVRRLTGVRGRAAARITLFAYLLLTLAYPGVKFVTDVLLRRGES